MPNVLTTKIAKGTSKHACLQTRGREGGWRTTMVQVSWVARLVMDIILNCYKLPYLFTLCYIDSSFSL